MTSLLSIQELQVAFRMGKLQRAHAVRGISFDLNENSTLALVGESGSGKSVTAMAIVNLLPDNAERSGRILWQGRDLLQASAADMRALRGREIACVFQDPMSSLNPVLPVGLQLCEPLRTHLQMSARQARERAEALLAEVGLAEPRRRLDAYAHELSGGQQQRVMIAMALACEPKLLIADEPTTALDVTIQRQILELLATLKARHRMSLLFISHDLALVGEIADQVVVMRHGTVREAGAAARIFGNPQDAYTRALLACRPSLQGPPPARLAVIDGPAAADRPAAAKDAQAPVLLEVRALAKSFTLRQGLFGRREFQAVRGVSFQLRRGHTLGVVGESGSGKTTLALALLRLIEPGGGEVLLDGRDAARQRAPGAAAAAADRLPEPLRVAEPTLQHRPDAGRADGHPRHRRRPRRTRAPRPRAAGQGGAGRQRLHEVPA